MSRKPLDITNCWDDNSIDDKIHELENLLMYGNDLSTEARRVIRELQKRKQELHKSN